MYKNHYIAVFLGYLDVKDNEMYSRAPKFVIYEQKEFNKEKKKLTKLSSAQSTVGCHPLPSLQLFNLCVKGECKRHPDILPS